jgi:hypothetical protein
VWCKIFTVACLQKLFVQILSVVVDKVTYISLILLGLLTLEDGADRLSRNVGTELPFLIA